MVFGAGPWEIDASAFGDYAATFAPRSEVSEVRQALRPETERYTALICDVELRQGWTSTRPLSRAFGGIKGDRDVRLKTADGFETRLKQRGSVRVVRGLLPSSVQDGFVEGVDARSHFDHSGRGAPELR